MLGVKCVLYAQNIGEFWQTIDKHINRKHNCPKCHKYSLSNKEEFIKRAKEVHRR